MSHPLLTQGGLTYRLQEALGLGGPQVGRRVVRALLLSAIAFAPLVALAVAQGWALAPDPRRSLLLDYGAYARFLLAVPAFLFAEGAVDARCTLMLREFIDTKLIGEGQRGGFRAAIERAVRLRDHPLPELGILLLAYLQARSALAFVVSTGHPTWWAPGIPDSSALSLAGWWYMLVSLPLYHFLALLWLWRLVIWTLALKWIADLDLQLRASQPDRTGGLGFLNLSLPPFGIVLFGYGASIGAVAPQDVVHQEATIQSLAPFMIGGVVVGVAVMVAPLLVFVNKLIVFQRQAILEYTALGARYTALFEARWIARRSDDESALLGTGDIQSLADLGNSFEIVRQMRNIPIDPRAVIPPALATAVPMLPAVVVAIGVQPLLKLIVKNVF